MTKDSMAVDFCVNPFPGPACSWPACSAPTRVTRPPSHASVLDVLDVLERRVLAEPVVEPHTWWTTSLLLAGVVATAAAFAV